MHYQMLLTKKESLAGLPEIIIEAAAETAKNEEKRRMGIHTSRSELYSFHDVF